MEYRVFTNWQKTIAQVVKNVPLIVMDLRGISQAVHFEFFHLIETEAYRRTVFILDPHSLVWLREQCPPAAFEELCISSEQPFITAIQNYGGQRSIVNEDMSLDRWQSITEWGRFGSVNHRHDLHCRSGLIEIRKPACVLR